MRPDASSGTAYLLKLLGRRWLGGTVRPLIADGWKLEHVVVSDAVSGVTLLGPDDHRLLVWSNGAIRWQRPAEFSTAIGHPEFDAGLSMAPTSGGCALQSLLRRSWSTDPAPTYRELDGLVGPLITFVDALTGMTSREIRCSECAGRYLLQSHRGAWRFIPRPVGPEHCALPASPTSRQTSPASAARHRSLPSEAVGRGGVSSRCCC